MNQFTGSEIGSLYISIDMLLPRALILLIPYSPCSVGMIEENRFFDGYALHSFMTFLAWALITRRMQRGAT